MYDPKTDKYPYTEYTDQHYLKVKKNNGLVFDENYPYIDKSKGFLFKQKLVRILLYTIVFPMCLINLGLRIKGRKKIKKYHDIIANGVVTVSNHIHLWDYIAIMKAIRPFKTNVVVWAPNIRGENGKLMRLVGGIPIPENDVRATIAFKESVDNLLNNGGVLQVYPEGSMWEYYCPIRPFKKGAAHFAVSNNKPILPFGFSYRKPTLIRKLFKQPGAITLRIGDPIYPDTNLPKSEREVDLLIRCHEEVCRLAGINPEKNIYPPLFDHTKKIDYY